MSTTRKVGRPRAIESTDGRPPEEVIVEAARRLFAKQGYSATTTRQIADAVGVKQPALFHYFGKKIDIFLRIVEASIEPELRFIDEESAHSLRPDVALYRYIRFVVFNLSTNENVLGSPYGRSELRGEEFRAYWNSLDKVTATAKQHIQAGVRAGLFLDVDVDAAAQQVFALIESPLNQRRIAKARAKEHAELAATLVLRGLLRDPALLEETRSLAAAVDDARN